MSEELKNRGWLSIENDCVPPQRINVLLYWSGLKEIHVGYLKTGHWYSASSKIRFWAMPDFYMPLPSPPKSTNP
jgi:hypothetical protein